MVCSVAGHDISFRFEFIAGRLSRFLSEATSQYQLYRLHKSGVEKDFNEPKPTYRVVKSPGLFRGQDSAMPLMLSHNVADTRVRRTMISLSTSKRRFRCVWRNFLYLKPPGLFFATLLKEMRQPMRGIL